MHLIQILKVSNMKSYLCREAAETFLFISECEYQCGFIGQADLIERHEVLSWLIDDSNEVKDPRSPNAESKFDEHVSRGEQQESHVADQVSETTHADDEFPILEFLPLGRSNPWVFTLGDPDNYPSVPHGHWQNQNRPWPKLNPYTGRTSKAKDREDTTLRLKREDMVGLWNSKEFRIHALKQIAHYQTTFPHYVFPVSASRIRRLPRWR